MAVTVVFETDGHDDEFADQVYRMIGPGSTGHHTTSMFGVVVWAGKVIKSRVPDDGESMSDECSRALIYPNGMTGYCDRPKHHRGDCHFP